MIFGIKKTSATSGPDRFLPGRETPIDITNSHHLLRTPLKPPFPKEMETALFAMGCFWGAERVFWQARGVYSTAVGYAAGQTPNPTYAEVCSGLTGHAEAVLVAFDPARIAYEDLLGLFWENHDPTQGMRQGNDHGSQYRSGIYTHGPEQERLAHTSRETYGAALSKAGWGVITTEILPAGEFFYAEDDHQQYLSKNPLGYCGLGGTGIAFDGK